MNLCRPESYILLFIYNREATILMEFTLFWSEFIPVISRLKGIRQLANLLKIERWAINANAVPVLPSGLRGWRTDWADFLTQGHLVPGSAASENKKSVKFEPSLACHRLRCCVLAPIIGAL